MGHIVRPPFPIDLTPRLFFVMFSKSIYLFVKLAALLIVALADPSNCLMQSVRPQTTLLIRQVTLMLAMAGFWILQSFLAPFLDPISNASEWVSRAGYTITAMIGLVGVSGASTSTKKAFQGPVLYVYAIQISSCSMQGT
jgi:hypothetical protein